MPLALRRRSRLDSNRQQTLAHQNEQRFKASKMFGLLSKKPLLDEVASQWLVDAYGWALRHFDAKVFFDESILVTPTNEHFPGRETSAEGMAALIFDRVQTYAGVRHWPFQIVDALNYVPTDTPPRLNAALLVQRGAHAANLPAHTAPLIIPYNPHQIGKPESLIASYAYILAYYLGTLAKELPPGGENYWPHATELLGVFMGFGIMFANTAYTFKGGCGSCYNPLAERAEFLSQDEVTYAMALFCALKRIPTQTVLPHLKSYLRPAYKRAISDIQRREKDLTTLRSIHDAGRVIDTTTV